MPKVYISSHDIEKARTVAKAVDAAGFPVISTWHLGDGPMKRSAEMEHVEMVNKARSNVAQIRGTADVLILVASEEPVPGGKFVEAGVAIGCGKRVLVWGRLENLMLRHPLVAAFEDLHELVYAIKPLAAA